MLKAIESNLLKAEKLLNSISDEVYGNTSIPPYHSSIGGHIRHVLDVFDCVFEGIPSEKINLINRKRDVSIEKFTKNGIEAIHRVIKNLAPLKGKDLSTIVEVTDDLGMGIITAPYTLAAILIQAHSHTIHHFATIGYIISQLEVPLNDETFGLNPTTPLKSNSVA